MPSPRSFNIPSQVDQQYARSHMSRDSRDRAMAESALRILIVDDDETDRAFFGLLLKQSDSNILIGEQATGESAKSLLASERVDAVLLDYHLSDYDADTLIAELRAIAEDPHLPIVVVSGIGDENKAAAAMRSGASDYLTKERLTSAALQRAISTAVAHSGLARQLAADRNELLALNADMAARARVMATLCQAVSRRISVPAEKLRHAIDSNKPHEQPPRASATDVLFEVEEDLQELAQILSDIAAMDDRRLSICSQPFDLQDAVSAAVARSQRTLNERESVKSIATTNDELPIVVGDHVRIRRSIETIAVLMARRRARPEPITITLQQDPYTEGVEVCIEGYLPSSDLHGLTSTPNTEAIKQSSSWLLERVFLALTREVLKRHGSDISIRECSDKTCVAFTLAHLLPD